MEFGLSPREKILREFGISAHDVWYVGAIDERIYADEILKSNGVTVQSAVREDGGIKIDLDVASHKSSGSYNVTLFLEKQFEIGGIGYYAAKMEESMHRCFETSFRRREADHHILAANEYVKKNLQKIGKKHGLGNIASHTEHKPIPPTIVDYFYTCKYVNANDRLKNTYNYIKQRYEKERR
ncbi:MAG: hypothetical protein ABIF85_02060 [Nanoarchaeota archaeon]|nr:hypothetical protein [Nanoarchaeota archaeon]MBU4300871.1 hypothetical protein [Nanoarchaeota archaeon]MBU4451423.1 hypothetical protein [Nanoarchaeota archaeon]MCG2724503.1 hypothetical protein [archaeon]